MRRIFERIFAALRPRRAYVIAAFALLTIAFVAGTSSLELEEDLTALLPVGDEVIDDYRMVISHFKAMDLLFIEVAYDGADDDEIDPREIVGNAADELNEKLASTDLLATVRYRTSQEEQIRLFAFLEEVKPLLFTAADAERVAEMMEPDAVEEGLADARRDLIEMQGLFMKEAIRSDPLQTRGLFFEKLSALRSGSENLDFTDGRIWSADGTRLLIMAEARKPPSEMAAAVELVEFVDAAQLEVEAANPGVAIRYAGGHRATVDNRFLIRGDIRRTLTVSLVAIAVVVLLMYRTRRLVVLTLLPPVFGGAAALAAFAVFSDRISAIVVGCGAVLVGIAVDYAIHVLFRYDAGDATAREGDGGADGARSLGKRLSPVAAPLVMGALTTTGAFLGLRASTLPGQRELGSFAAIGIVAAALCALVLLPQLLSLRKRSQARAIVPLPRVFELFFSWHARHSGIVLALLVAACVAAGFGIGRVNFDGDVMKLNGTREETKRDEASITANWGSDMAGTHLVVSAGSIDEALALNDQAWEMLKSLEAEGLLDSPSSVAPLLPSTETQRANASRWRAFWDERGPSLRSEIDHAGKKLGFSGDAFDPFWQSLATVREPVDPTALDGTVLGDALGQRIVEGEDGKTYVLSTFYLSDPSRTGEIASRIRQVVPDAVVVSGRAFVERAQAIARESLERLGVVSAVVVAAILLVFFGRLELAVAVCLPLGLSLFWTLGALGLAGVSVNMFNSLFIIFIFGMAVDYSIFIVGEHLSEFRGEGQDLAVTGGAITISALTTVAGFGALVLARHPALFSIGLTAAIGMGTGLAAALLAAPLIMRIVLYRGGEVGLPTFLKVFTLAVGFVAFCLVLLICRIIAHPIILVLSPFDRKKRQRRMNAVLRLFCRVFVIYYPYGRRRYLGMEFLKQGGGGKILIVNHNSIIDILSALSLPIDVRMVVKSWVWHAPLMGPVVRAAGNVYARGGDAEDVLARCEELLQDGASVLMFPEGTRSQTGEIGRFHVGAFELAARSGAELVPVVFTGTRECVPKHAFWAGDHEIVIKASEPMRPREDETSREFMRRGRERMLQEWERAIAVAGDGAGFRNAIAGRYTYRGAFVEHYVKWKLKLDPIYRALHGMVPDEGRILDLGCGHGLASNYLAAQSTRREIVGVDADERKIAAARGSAVAPSRMRFDVADILEWEIPEARGALLIDVLHYWPPATQERMLARISEALPRGATFVMREACRGKGAGHRFVRLTERFGTFIGHNRSLHTLAFRSEDEYIDMLTRAGFSRVRAVRELGLGSNVVFECEKSDE